MRRRLCFATPFVVTLACGGSQRDATEVTDPAPMRDIAQPTYEMTPDAAVTEPTDDAAIATTRDAPAEEMQIAAPLCYVHANPPGYQPCVPRRVLKIENDGGSRLAFAFVAPTGHDYRQGMTVVAGKAMPMGRIERCTERTCTATIELARDRLPAVVYVVTTK